MELASITYSHSSYFDVLSLYLKRFPGDTLIAADKTYEDYETLIYDPESSYTERLIQVLEQIKYDRILYTHEDHILYRDPDWGEIQDLIEEDIDFIRLCRTGKLILGEKRGNLYKIKRESPDAFAVQPTIWKRESFISFLKKSGPSSIWDLERNADIESLNGSLYLDGNEKTRGGHYDSNIFPCILTAICKGKWNMSEYKEELNMIFAENNFKTNREFC